MYICIILCFIICIILSHLSHNSRHCNYSWFPFVPSLIDTFVCTIWLCSSFLCKQPPHKRRKNFQIPPFLMFCMAGCAAETIKNEATTKMPHRHKEGIFPNALHPWHWHMMLACFACPTAIVLQDWLCNPIIYHLTWLRKPHQSTLHINCGSLAFFCLLAPRNQKGIGFNFVVWQLNVIRNPSH